MSYQIGNKTYTDHPMMDEIVYECKKILKGIVIKNDVKAGDLETDYSITYAELYSIMKDRDGYVGFELFPFNQEILSAYGFPSSDIRAYLENKYAIPEEIRDDLTDFANDWFKNIYFDSNSRPIGEPNNYYRTLYGLPPYDTGTDYYISIDTSLIPSSYELVQNPDGNYYIHEQNNKVITLLYSLGYIDDLKDTYKGFGYSYLDHLGDRSIPTLKARKAAKWDILYMPNVYNQIEDKFTEFYKINREMYANRSYQEYYAQIGEYYDELMIIIVLSETFENMITDVPEWYIRRDVFDIRSCQYFFESYGVEYFKEIPLRYQIKLVKNLNKLIKYKSTSRNFDDIIAIFDATDTTYIDKYWLYKKRNPGVNSEYSDTGDLETDYTLEFVASDINESYDDYIRDNRYIMDYDSVTLSDMYWDGENSHQLIKDVILGMETDMYKTKEFTIEGSKYMSINQTIPVEDYIVESSYFLGMLLSSDIDLSYIKIPVPSIDDTALFEIPNLFLFLQVLTKSFYKDFNDPNNTATSIENIEYDEYPLEEDINEDPHYNWKKKYMPEIYTHKVRRIYGFNPDADIQDIIKTLEKRHSRDVFGLESDLSEKETIILDDEEYKAQADTGIVSDLKINDFIIPVETITDLRDLVDIYENNKEIYENLNKMIAVADTEDDKKILEYVFQELFTKKFDTDYYTLSDGTVATDLVDLLKDRDYILYLKYMSLIADSSTEARQDNIRVIMGDVINTLNYYFQGYGLNYLFAFTTTESFSAVIRYIYLMINFFKSYKVHFLDPYTTYQTSTNSGDLGGESIIKAIDNIAEWRNEYKHTDKSFAQDRINGFNLEMYHKESVYSGTNVEKIDIYEYYSPDPLSDLVYDGLDAQGSTEESKDLDGGIADTNHNLPYETINGGNSYLGLMNFNDLNGGMADELYRDYYEIDGGDAHHPEDVMKDYWGKQGFNYMFDNGAASNTAFRSNTIDLKVLGKDITAEVIISPRSKDYIVTRPSDDDGEFEFGSIGGTNIIPVEATAGPYEFGAYGNPQISSNVSGTYDMKIYATIDNTKEENIGLYMDSGYLANSTELKELQEEKLRLQNYINNDIANAEQTMLLLSDDGPRQAMIDNLANQMIYPFTAVLGAIENDEFENQMKRTIENMAQAMYNSVSDRLDPYAWEEL